MIYLLALYIITCAEEVPDSYGTSFLVLQIVSIGCYCTHATKFENFLPFLAEN